MGAYVLVGFNPTWECFGVFLCTLVAFAAVAGSLFMLIGLLAPNIAVAQIISPLVIVLFMLFGGFYVNVDNIPVYYEWLYYLSFFNYGYEILCYNELNGWGEPIEFTCETTSARCIDDGNEELEILGYGD